MSSEELILINQITFLNKFAEEYPGRYTTAVKFTKNINILEKICKNWTLFAVIYGAGGTVIDDFDFALNMLRSFESFADHRLLQFTDINLWLVCNLQAYTRLTTALRFIKNPEGSFYLPMVIIDTGVLHAFTFRCVNPNLLGRLANYARDCFNAKAIASCGQISVDINVENESDVAEKCIILNKYVLDREPSVASAIAQIIPIHDTKCNYKILIGADFIVQRQSTAIPIEEAMSIKHSMTKEEKEIIARNWITYAPPIESISAIDYHKHYRTAISQAMAEDDFNQLVYKCGYSASGKGGALHWVRANV